MQGSVCSAGERGMVSLFCDSGNGSTGLRFRNWFFLQTQIEAKTDPFSDIFLSGGINTGISLISMPHSWLPLPYHMQFRGQ